MVWAVVCVAEVLCWWLSMLCTIVVCGERWRIWKLRSSPLYEGYVLALMGLSGLLGRQSEAERARGNVWYRCTIGGRDRLPTLKQEN